MASIKLSDVSSSPRWRPNKDNLLRPSLDEQPTPQLSPRSFQWTRGSDQAPSSELRGQTENEAIETRDQEARAVLEKYTNVLMGEKVVTAEMYLAAPPKDCIEGSIEMWQWRVARFMESPIIKYPTRALNLRSIVV